MREKNKTIRQRLVCCLLCFLCVPALSGCGRRLVMTKGFSSDQVFRVGNRVCTESELRVYFLDLEKQCCRMFGSDSLKNNDLRESLRQKGISEASRVLALRQLAVQNNIMLTDKEEGLCEKAGTDFYNSLSEKEKAYIGLGKSDLQDMYMDYALADKTYESAGDDFEDRYDAFVGTMDSDLNRSLWDRMTVEKVDGDDSAPSFSEVYEKYFG